MKKEEIESKITSIKEKLDDTTQALVSEDLLGLIGSFSNAIDTIDDLQSKIDKLNNDNAELLKVNGRLFQKIGFDKEEKEEKKDEKNDVELKIEDVVNEKGELI